MLPIKVIDSHTHLSSPDFEQDRAEVLRRAKEVCSFLIDIGAGTAEKAHLAARQLAEAEECVYFTAGIHPHDAGSLGRNSNLRAEIEELHAHPKCVAVGECGLDFFYGHSSKEDQFKCFEWQIHRATQLQLPLMIHTREAEKDTMTLLKDYRGTAVFHCFTSSQALADFGVANGFFISFSGIVTFKKARELQEVAKRVPIENLLIETDAPYLAPEPLRGKRNESSFIEKTARFLAELRGMDLEEFCEITRLNALRCFSKIQNSSSAR
jgi:TatD DNase family protein